MREGDCPRRFLGARCRLDRDHPLVDHVAWWHWGAFRLDMTWVQASEPDRYERITEIVEMICGALAVLLLLTFIGLVLASWAAS